MYISYSTVTQISLGRGETIEAALEAGADSAGTAGNTDCLEVYEVSSDAYENAFHPAPVSGGVESRLYAKRHFRLAREAPYDPSHAERSHA